MIIAEHGRSPWHIVMPHPADETTKHAADELHDFLMKICGASLPVQTELTDRTAHEILIGRSARLGSMETEEDWTGLGDEGFVIRAENERILIAGNKPRGTLYGVYTLLEDYFGCSWLSSGYSVIPKAERLELPEIHRRESPAFESREAYWRDAFDGNYAVRNKMNSNKADISPVQGGHLKFHRFHHTFDELVPVSRYFDEHPEYFSMVDGKRIREETQLCLTNPDVLALTITKVKEWIRDNPDCNVFSVAQNDCYHPCACPRCAAVDREEGSHAGTLIRFVNAVADAVRVDDPDVLIHTFAYQYTRKAPRLTKPRDNVIVRLCGIECCFSHPLDGSVSCEAIDPAEQHDHPQCASLGETGFIDDLKEWGKITRHLYVWDYVTNFHHYLMPLPNLNVLQINLCLFKNAGVKGILEQGDFAQGSGGHMAELEAYLQSKLMWDPACDAEFHMQRFIKGYYGEKAAPLIREYIRLWQEAGEKAHVSIFDAPDAPYVSDQLLEASCDLLGQAIFMTEDSEQRGHTEKLALSMQYLILARMPEDTPGRDALISAFGWRARMAGVAELSERWCLEESLQEMRKTNKENQKLRKIRCDYKM